MKIYGDFFGVGDMAEVEQLLTGKPYSKEGIEEALESLMCQSISVVLQKKS